MSPALTRDGPRDRDRDVVLLDGVVIESTRGILKVRAVLGSRPHFVTCTLGGRLRANHIRVVPGDHVTIEVGAYDASRGRVVFRSRS